MLEEGYKGAKKWKQEGKRAECSTVGLTKVKCKISLSYDICLSIVDKDSQTCAGGNFCILTEPSLMVAFKSCLIVAPSVHFLVRMLILQKIYFRYGRKQGVSSFMQLNGGHNCVHVLIWCVGAGIRYTDMLCVGVQVCDCVYSLRYIYARLGFNMCKCVSVSLDQRPSGSHSDYLIQL